MAKEKETENRSERERFLDCMLKEILSGWRNPGDRLPTESELAEQYGLRKTNVHLGLQELERLGFLKVVPRHATYVAPYWEQANLETLAAIMTHGGKPQPELVDAFLELREMVALGWFRWTGRNPKTEQMRHLYGLLERMEAIAYAPDGEKDNPKFLDLVNQFLVCMFAESDNMIFRVLLRSSRELAEQYGLRKTNVHLGLQELERLGFLKVVPRHATYVAPYWEQANLETLAAIMTHGGKPQPELVDAFLELREMVALGWFRWTGRNPKTEQMRHLYGLLERMEAIAYAPDGEKDNPKFLDLVNQFLVCMFAESDNMIFRVLLRSSRELAHVTYYIVAYTLDTQELCKTYRTVLDGLTSGHASEAIDYWCGWSDRVTVQYREALLQLGSE